MSSGLMKQECFSWFLESMKGVLGMPRMPRKPVSYFIFKKVF